MKRRNKIKRTKENREYYIEILEQLCRWYDYDYLDMCFDVWREKSLYIKSHFYWINLYDIEGNVIYKTKTYGNYLNAYGEAIKYLERIK